jgi:hypothetical protein
MNLFFYVSIYSIELRGSRIRRSEDDVDSRLPGSKPTPACLGEVVRGRCFRGVVSGAPAGCPGVLLFN